MLVIAVLTLALGLYIEKYEAGPPDIRAFFRLGSLHYEHGDIKTARAYWTLALNYNQLFDADIQPGNRMNIYRFRAYENLKNTEHIK